MGRLVLITVLLFSTAAFSDTGFVTLTYNETRTEKNYSFLTDAPMKRGKTDELLEQGEKLYAQNRFESAAQYLKGALQQAKSATARYRIYLLLGRCYQYMKMYEERIHSLMNAEAVLSSNRSELFLGNVEFCGSFHDNLAIVYREISLSYLFWNKYASSIIYLWQCRRIGGETYSLEDSGKLVPIEHSAQKKLLNYPLYKFMASSPGRGGQRPAVTKYYRVVREGDRNFREFKNNAGIEEKIFLKPIPEKEVEKPDGKRGLYAVHYNSRGDIVLVTYNDREAENFNSEFIYEEGKPVSSLVESHTYHYKYVKLFYENGSLRFLFIVTIPTQAGHFGFMPDTRLYVFR